MLPFRQELGLASARPSSVTAPLARVASPYWVDRMERSASLRRLKELRTACSVGAGGESRPTIVTPSIGRRTRNTAPAGNRDPDPRPLITLPRKPGSRPTPRSSKCKPSDV
jgi:hypothetical protein